MWIEKLFHHSEPPSDARVWCSDGLPEGRPVPLHGEGHVQGPGPSARRLLHAGAYDFKSTQEA